VVTRLETPGGESWNV